MDRARMSHYKLTSTVILHLATENDALGTMDLSGNMTRQVEADLPVDSDASPVANVGRLVEDMELKMRNLLRMQLFLSRPNIFFFSPLKLFRLFVPSSPCSIKKNNLRADFCLENGLR
jgi:F-actin capping protein, beta subunit